jgi:hypothetical protein
VRAHLGDCQPALLSEAGAAAEVEHFKPSIQINAAAAAAAAAANAAAAILSLHANAGAAPQDCAAAQLGQVQHAAISQVAAAAQAQLPAAQQLLATSSESCHTEQYRAARWRVTSQSKHVLSASLSPAHPPELGQRRNVVQGGIICTVGINHQAAQGRQAGQQGRCVWIQAAGGGTTNQRRVLNTLQ